MSSDDFSQVGLRFDKQDHGTSPARFKPKRRAIFFDVGPAGAAPLTAPELEGLAHCDAKARPQLSRCIDVQGGQLPSAGVRLDRPPRHKQPFVVVLRRQGVPRHERHWHHLDGAAATAPMAFLAPRGAADARWNCTLKKLCTAAHQAMRAVNGIGYRLLHFRPINPAARLFAALFVDQVALLAVPPSFGATASYSIPTGA